MGVGLLRSHRIAAGEKGLGGSLGRPAAPGCRGTPLGNASVGARREQHPLLDLSTLEMHRGSVVPQSPAWRRRESCITPVWARLVRTPIEFPVDYKYPGLVHQGCDATHTGHQMDIPGYTCVDAAPKPVLRAVRKGGVRMRCSRCSVAFPPLLPGLHKLVSAVRLVSTESTVHDFRRHRTRQE